MKTFKKGDIVKCFMYYGDKNNPSEYTGKIAFILECLEPENYEPFIPNNEEEIVTGITGQQYNLSIAKDVRYRVMIDKKIVLCNHLCFLDLDDFIDWQIAFRENDFVYL